MINIQKKISPEASSIWKILESVTDPEIPVLTIIDLGIIKKINITDEEIEVVITPTYSGCPAMDMITMNIRAALNDAGYKKVTVKSVLSPAWTTDLMSEEGKNKLKEYGIAPPRKSSRLNKMLFAEEEPITCPQCNSTDTRVISEFGSTACKSLHQCNTCKEPFDYFKCH
ncbi:phenylacetate-CoA oxygenase subunit PaaJ [soil metagenome]